jgi:hypothetical protein
MEVLAAVLLEILVFWDVMMPPLVNSYHHTKCLYLFTQQHSMTSQKTWIIIVRDCKISEKYTMTKVYSVQFSRYHVLECMTDKYCRYVCTVQYFDLYFPFVLHHMAPEIVVFPYILSV